MIKSIYISQLLFVTDIEDKINIILIYTLHSDEIVALTTISHWIYKLDRIITITEDLNKQFHQNGHHQIH